jgi:hypothetical protein
MQRRELMSAPLTYCLVAKTEYVSEAGMMERDGICNIAGTAKHDAHEPSSVGTPVQTPLFVFGAGDDEGNCPLWDGHIIDAILPLV